MNRMARMARGLLLMFTLFAICSLQGCKDYNELNDLALVDMVGVDLNEDGTYQAYYQVLNPNGVAGSKTGSFRSPLFTFEFRGKSWPEFTRLATQTLSRKLFINHFQAYIVSERLAKHGIGDLLNFLESDPRRRMATSIYVTKSPIKDIMNTYVPMETNPGKELRSIQKLQYEVTGQSDNKSNLKTLLENFENEQLAYISMIKLTDQEPFMTTKRFQTIEGNRGNFQYVGASIIKQAHAIGELKAPQLSTLFFLLGTNKSLLQDLKWNESESAQIQMIGKPKTDYQLFLQHGQPKLDIRIKPSLELVTIDQEEKLDSKTLRRLEAMFDKKMEDQSIKLIKLANEKQWDLLGIQDRIAKRINPKWATLKSNPVAWMETDVSVTVHSSIIKTGTLLTPYKGGK
ncbi:Ger(x)C family spore germination protein [Paenibacillus sp. MMS18-CY102]|uniref:Ger(x)C family spore germination protein n=1 Tax=Paenibacillus sp. MMS18-CY102 TaxID=2682849 RepID=UPI0013658C32|nr:Ger(x)C family spore germination protein [Paenibacillus sp. MMS18-CY102]MWC27996.1 Ger(x)C family spore germination protein [Paenibacillus sp. MMS18-CY102]